MVVAKYRAWLVLGFLAILVVLGWGAQQTDSPEGPFRPRPARVSGESTDGVAVLVPNRIEAAAIGSYELWLSVGAEGIAPGGAFADERGARQRL